MRNECVACGFTGYEDEDFDECPMCGDDNIQNLYYCICLECQWEGEWIPEDCCPKCGEDTLEKNEG